MELPQKFEINHEFHDTATSKIMSKINELIEYLESQKEGEEPKQIEETAMTKTIKELLDEIEEIFDYNLSLHKPEGRRQLERVISQVEALVRSEVLEEVERNLPIIDTPYLATERTGNLYLGRNQVIEEISTIINNLRLK